MPKEHAGHSKRPLPTTKEMTLHKDITRWSIPKSRLIIFLAVKDGEALSLSFSKIEKQSAETISGADCGSDHELLIAKFRLQESTENH